MKTLLIIILISVSFLLNAQSRYKNITEQRIKYISSKMTLTETESQQFWPLFRAYHEQRENATYKKANLKIVPLGLSNEEYLKIVNGYINKKVQQALLLEEYHKKYLEVLPAAKLIEFYKYNDEFNKNLLRQIKAAGKNKRPNSNKRD